MAVYILEGYPLSNQLNLQWKWRGGLSNEPPDYFNKRGPTAVAGESEGVGGSTAAGESEGGDGFDDGDTAASAAPGKEAEPEETVTTIKIGSESQYAVLDHAAASKALGNVGAGGTRNVEGLQSVPRGFIHDVYAMKLVTTMTHLHRAVHEYAVRGAPDVAPDHQRCRRVLHR